MKVALNFFSKDSKESYLPASLKLMSEWGVQQLAAWMRYLAMDSAELEIDLVGVTPIVKIKTSILASASIPSELTRERPRIIVTIIKSIMELFCIQKITIKLTDDESKEIEKLWNNLSTDKLEFKDIPIQYDKDPK